ncbi:MAG: glycoside hydrolase/phage tail family protein, partial [Proteobacteria bacterium]|nr:glycoside hydrolase/phage tail family protein [Pseudomonadota bacterium]
MATLVLQAAGSALGAAFGGPMLAAVGQAAGAVLGGVIDRSLMGGPGKRYVEGPRLKTLDGISASEGAPIPRVYGRVRLGGQVIWATRFEEQMQAQRSGKSGGKGGAPKQQTVTTTYSYFANLAVALCEGPVGMVRRVWADGKPLDLTTVTMRVYPGSETQEADPLIAARQGESPAYRGTAYVVFERLPLEAYGNRLPQLSFEVVRPVGALTDHVRGVDLIPGASEFAYQPGQVLRILGRGASQPENRNQLTHASDFSASLDALEAVLPKARSVALVTSWFGTDLRASHAAIVPGVDNRIKTTTGDQWSVAGKTRETAHLVSQIDGRAAYGGTPSDSSLLAAIADLRARGLSVVFYPFVMMDIAAGNSLPDPYGATEQAAFPWRGRITLDIAPGRVGSSDGTTAAASAVATFFGTATAAQFAVSAGTVTYSGPSEWTYRRMVLHNAALCKAAGGVDAFIIGSELIGLIRIRSASGVYPAVQQLKSLAGEVRALLGPGVKIGYAADWTEYGAHVQGGGAEVRFPLDPLWSDVNIDFVGIDFYPPLADWRDGEGHADAGLWPDGRGLDYLTAGLGGGEAFDWYYADATARATQQRTPITDDAYGKPWIYCAKDLKSWWSEPHVERMNGVETVATGWQPGAKPIWLTEVGCPAVDKGANAPNLFPDAKSSESALPPLSSGARDDLLAARFLEAISVRFDPDHPAFEPANNPVSPLYGGRMVDPARIHAWAWDARPYPAFPHLREVWGDAANWQTGHWLNGRAEGMALDRLLKAITADYGLDAPGFDQCDGFLDGYVIDRPMSARSAIEPLLSLFAIEARVSGGKVRFAGRGFGRTHSLSADDLVPDRQGRDQTRSRAQETELARTLTVGFSDAESQYQRAAVSAQRPRTASRRENAMETTAVLRRSEAEHLAASALQDHWTARETVTLSLRPGLRALEPGDVVTFAGDAPPVPFRLTRVVDGLARQCEARRIEHRTGLAGAPDPEVPIWNAPGIAGPPFTEVLHLPVDPGEPTPLALVGIAATPWRGPYTLWRETAGGSFSA